MKTTLILSDVTELVSDWSAEFTRQREKLIQLDQQVGDGDLGITMQRGFRAASLLIPDENKGIEHYFIQCGLAIAKAAPSTMGTLMATGFMYGGRALPANTHELDARLAAAFFCAFASGIACRGKANPGEKTVLDVLLPAGEAMSRDAENYAVLSQSVRTGLIVAQRGLEATRYMIPQHGKAAIYSDISSGLIDPGGKVALILYEVLDAYVNKL